MPEHAATVLYVEDNTENRVLVRRILEAEGHSVVEAGTAADGLRLATELRPDIILVDINMPDVDGLTLTSQIRAHPPLAHTPIIAITANVMRGDRERTLEAGCDGYIQKPIDVDVLPRQIARFLHQEA